MDKVSGRLLVFFEEPFWVGVFERVAHGKLSVCKVTFGAEPKDSEVLDFVLNHYYDLEFSPEVDSRIRQTADNPKRRQRMARKQLEPRSLGTKSQQALARQREEQKFQRRQISSEQRDADKERKRLLREEKRKAKHRGR